MIVMCRRGLLTTVNEDYLCLSRLNAEEILDRPDHESDSALEMAARVLALEAEIRRLDNRDGKVRVSMPVPWQKKLMVMKERRFKEFSPDAIPSDVRHDERDGPFLVDNPHPDAWLESDERDFSFDASAYPVMGLVPIRKPT